MAHFSLVRSPVTNWIDGTTVLPSELEALDAEQAAAINGDEGGVYAPTGLITISGDGLQTTVPLAILRGGLLKTGADDSIELQDGDFPTLGATHTGRTRTIQHPPCLAKGFPAWLWRVRKEDGGLQAYTPSWTTIANGQSSPQVAIAFVPFRAYDRATLASVKVYFRVGQPHANPPPTMPRLRVCRVDASGNVSPLTSIAAGADVDGFVAVPGPSSGAAWYAKGATQSLTITCDQDNLIDVANYAYHVEIHEEGGLTGDTFVLDRASSPSWQNKLQYAASKPTLWTVPVWVTATGYAAGQVVFPTLGNPAASLYFACTTAGTTGSTEPAWPTAIGATVTDGSVVWTALASTQKFGNIWQSIETNYTAITDTHWQ